MRVAGIDPGLASLGIVLMDGARLVDFADYATKPTGAHSANEDGIYRSQYMADRVCEFLARNKPVDMVVIEEFVTRSGVNYSAAWSTPFCIGFLVNELMGKGYPVRFRLPRMLPKKDVRPKVWANYCKTREGLSAINELPKTRREHVMCAALHAIGYLEKGGSQSRRSPANN